MQSELKLILFLFLISVSISGYSLTSAQPAEHPSFKAVVHLAIPAYTSDGPVTGYCNGTLVSRNTIVTAAHCVVSSYLFTGQPLKIEIGEYRYKETEQGTIRLGYRTTQRHESSVKVQLQPGVSPTAAPNRIPPENDYAILKLQTEISLPEDFVFPTVLNANLSSAQVSQTVVVTVNPLAYISSTNTKQVATLNQVQYLGKSLKSNSLARVEEGDSGAPVFAVVQGRSYLIGVVKGRAQNGFSNWDVFAVWGARGVTP